MSHPRAFPTSERESEIIRRAPALRGPLALAALLSNLDEKDQQRGHDDELEEDDDEDEEDEDDEDDLPGKSIKSKSASKPQGRNRGRR